MPQLGSIHTLSPEEWLLARLERHVPAWWLHAPEREGRLDEWRAGLTAALEAALGLHHAEPCDLDVKVLDRFEEEGVTVERLLYNSEAGVTVPAHLLLPHVRALPQPAVVLCHDRGPGKSSALLAPQVRKRDPHETLARRLLAAGLIVLVPDAVGAGERQARELPQIAVGAWLGRPLLGRWVHDVRRAADVLRERQEVEGSRLAIAGAGPGGATALYAMALDDRFRAGVVSGQLTGYADRVRALSAAGWRGLANELPAMAPDVLRLAGLPDIAALCAPRPLMMLHAPGEAACPVEAAVACADEIAEDYGLLGGGAGLFAPAFLPELGSRAWDLAREFLEGHLRAQYV